MSLRVLFLGGAGMIGTAVATELEGRGAELTAITRSTPQRSLPAGTETLRGDVRDPEQLRALLGKREFDVVVNWVGFEPAHLAPMVDQFGGSVGQFVFVSTCAVFARPAPLLPMTESSPRRHNRFGYARGKLACEELLEGAYRNDQFPVTIIRPAHTYDQTTVPILGGWTVVDRMRTGRAVVVHGDGTSLWTLMHSGDFARAVAPILGNRHAVGESVNVVSGDILTWDQIHLELATAAGVVEPRLIHRSSEVVGAELTAWADVLEEDFRHSLLFDTTKLLQLSPGFAPRTNFSEGARGIVGWFDGDVSRRTTDAELNAAFDRLTS